MADDGPDIRITAAMIEAGRSVFAQAAFNDEERMTSAESARWLERIYRAMELAKIEGRS